MFCNNGRNSRVGLQTGLEHPCINRKASRTWVEIRTIGNINTIVYAIETKRLLDLTRSKRRPVLQCAVVAVLNIVGIAITGPPTDHVSGWRRACATLAGAAGVDDCLNLRLGKRAIENFYFVDQASPVLDRADIDRLPGSDRHWLAARRENQGRIGRASEHAVHVQLQGSAVIRKRNMLKLIER
jgi:hypothetical protein